MINTKIIAYNLRIKTKNQRKSHLSPSMIFLILRKIGSLPYNRVQRDSRVKRIGEYYVTMDPKDLPENLNDDAPTHVNFFIGKETKETWPTRDDKGEFESYGLPDDKNLCFKTHGCFLFKKNKETNEWSCILLLERRQACIGLSTLIQYFKAMDCSYSYGYEVIASEPDFLKKVREFHNLKYAVLKNHHLTFGKTDGIGTLKRKIDESGYKVTYLSVILSKGDTAIEKFLNLVKDYLGLEKDATSNDIQTFVDKTELVLIGKTAAERLDLFSNLVLYPLEIEQTKERDMDTFDFYAKLDSTLRPSEITRLFDLIEKR